MKTIAVDWDGTLVEYHSYEGPNVFGPSIPAMVERVKGWLAEGHEVLIFTTRMSIEHEPSKVMKTLQAIAIRLKGMGLPSLEVTANKYARVDEFWDDRAIRVERNTGRIESG